MSDVTRNAVWVASGTIDPSPPPPNTTGVIGWTRENLFSSIPNSIMTILALAFIAWSVPPIFNWAIFNAVVDAGSLRECRAINPDGACWAVINERFYQFIYGFYPETERWRPNIAFILLVVALVPVLFDNVPARKALLIHTMVYPVIAFWLIWGGLGLEPVESARIGGFLLTMIIGVTGIAASLPIGVALALGRQSEMVFIKTVSVVFIEMIRGVPLITLLFVANVLLAYFLPPQVEFDKLLRVVIMVTFFASAYMAEVIRGGIAALPQGQYEAANAMGLTYFQSMRLIILPQALKISIPGIVNNFIGLFKDTTLVSVIALFDPLGIIAPIRAHQDWNGIVWELYGFIAIFFFLACFLMSRYSVYLENKLHTGHKR